MPKKSLKKAKYTESKGVEITENGVLMKLLGNTVLPQITGGNDDFPNVDGYVYLLEEDRSVSGQSLQIQVKPLQTNNKGLFATCRPTLLAHAHDSNSPVLVIGVDIENSMAYWRYLSPEFVDAYVEERASIPEQTITLYFETKNKISATDTAYLKEWKKVCNHHRNEANDKIIGRYIKHLGKSYGERITLERLDTLRNLAFYRTTDGKYPLADLLLESAEEVRNGDTKLKATYIDVLKQMVYHKTELVVSILHTFLDEEASVKESVKKILIDVSKYNIHVLRNIGYQPQRIMLDSLPKLLSQKDEETRKLGLEIAGNILETSFEGTSNPTLNTLTFHHGPLSLTPFLQTLRKDVVDLLLKAAQNDESLTVRIKALKAISHSFHMPEWPFGSPEAEAEFTTMLDKNAKYVIGKYKKLILDDKGKPIDIFPLVYEVERQLALLKVWRRGISASDTLLDTLRKPNTNYSFYKLFAGDELDLRLEEGYDAVEKRKASAVVQALDSVSDKTIETWYKRFQIISSFKEHTEDWRLHTFRDFLARLAIQKPKLADKLLAKIFTEKGDMYSFAGSLIFGLRRSSLSLWDKYVERIQRDQSLELTTALLQSFEMGDRADINVRDKDITLIRDISESANNFSFLDRQNTQLRYQVMRCLIYVSVANPKIFRQMILQQIEYCAAMNSMFFDQLGTGIHWKWFDLSDWSNDDLKRLTDFLIQSGDLDWNHEQVLFEIGKNDFELMMSVFDKRMAREVQRAGSRYTAIPHRFSTEITSFIAEHPNYPQVLKAWISKANDCRDLYAMDLGRFVHEIGGSALTNALTELIETGKDSNLKKVLSLFPLIDAPDFDICFKIVAATDNEDIWSTVGGRLHSTGVLGGSYGENLWGNAMRSLKERLEQELHRTENTRVKRFCEKQIGFLEIDIKRSDEEHEKEMREEQEEFNSNKEED